MFTHSYINKILSSDDDIRQPLLEHMSKTQNLEADNELLLLKQGYTNPKILPKVIGNIILSYLGRSDIEENEPDKYRELAWVPLIKNCDCMQKPCGSSFCCSDIVGICFSSFIPCTGSLCVIGGFFGSIVDCGRKAKRQYILREAEQLRLPPPTL